MPLTKEQVMSVQHGEVIHYRGGFLVVDEVDAARGVVSGNLMNCVYGVNALPIDQLQADGIAIAKWTEPMRSATE